MGRVAQRPLPSHPIPDWRPGVVYWRPTSDGREIGVYPQFFGAGLLYRGPLDPEDPGFDESWRFDTLQRAIAVASSWDGESPTPVPARYHNGPGDHRVSRTHKHAEVRGVKEEEEKQRVLGGSLTIAPVEEIGKWVPVAMYEQVETIRDFTSSRVIATRKDLTSMQEIEVEGDEAMDPSGTPGLIIDSIHPRPIPPLNNVTVGPGTVYADRVGSDQRLRPGLGGGPRQVAPWSRASKPERPDMERFGPERRD